MNYFNYFIESYVHGGRIGVLVELDVSDTFAFRAGSFKDFARDLALQVAAMNPASVEELIAQPSIKDPEQTVGERMASLVQEIRTNVLVRRFVRWSSEPQRPNFPEPPRTPAVIYDLRKANEA